ncbi:phosphatase domain-containing protein [Ammonicoccus fulvus]|uniref:Phosphatase domain-containing protein n=1 Tax=Ammonicoccus fulvus TaxID=3138240 RepID=A0ABZ3FQ90_9ACTN
MSEPSVLQALIAGPDGASESAAILDLIRGADTADLNRMLADLHGPSLFTKLDPGRRAELTHLLGRQRLDELEASPLAHVVHGLQSSRRTALRDEVLVEIVVSRRGTDLVRLKNLINTAEDHQDLEDLVWVDLHESDRRRVLAHIERESAGLSIGDPKVLSDIDDTVFCKLHDRRWPRGLIYPGALALLDALDLGPTDEPFDLGDLTFVTARPADAWGLVENLSRTALRRAGVSRLSVLSGSLRALVSKEAMAFRKLENIDHYRRLFPEYQLVFIGDSGQGDVIVAETLVRTNPEATRLVMIHDVVESSQEVRDRHAAAGIVFFDTYVGAAAEAYERGLISARGLGQVAKESVGGFERTRWDSVQQRDRMRGWFERDLARVENLLADAGS